MAANLKINSVLVSFAKNEIKIYFTNLFNFLLYCSSAEKKKVKSVFLGVEDRQCLCGFFEKIRLLSLSRIFLHLPTNRLNNWAGEGDRLNSDEDCFAKKRFDV